MLALVIPYSGNPTGTFGNIFIVRIITLNKCPFSNFFGSWQGESSPKIVDISHSVFREPQSISIGIIPMNKCLRFGTVWGLLAGEIPHVKLQALVIPYTGNPNERFDTVLALVSIP